MLKCLLSDLLSVMPKHPIKSQFKYTEIIHNIYTFVKIIGHAYTGLSSSHITIFPGSTSLAFLINSLICWLPIPLKF